MSSISHALSSFEPRFPWHHLPIYMRFCDIYITCGPEASYHHFGLFQWSQTLSYFRVVLTTVGRVKIIKFIWRSNWFKDVDDYHRHLRGERSRTCCIRDHRRSFRDIRSNWFHLAAVIGKLPSYIFTVYTIVDRAKQKVRSFLFVQWLNVIDSYTWIRQWDVLVRQIMEADHLDRINIVFLI